MTTKPRIRILKFTGMHCPTCHAVDKSGIWDELKKSHPDVIVKPLVVTNEEGEAPKGSEFEGRYALSDEYEVQALPVYVFEVEGAGEVARFEGALSKAKMLKTFDEIIEECRARIGDMELEKKTAW